MKCVFVIVLLFAVCANKGEGNVVKAARFDKVPDCAVALSGTNGGKWILEKKSNDVVAGTVELTYNTTFSGWIMTGEKSISESSLVDFILAAAFFPNGPPLSDTARNACYRMMSLP